MTRGLYVSHETMSLNRAKDHLAEALACLSFPTLDRKGAALVLIGIALLKIAESDPTEGAREVAEQMIRDARERR